MSHLLFVRHAETDLAGTFCGHADPPLNDRGHEQLATLLTSFADETIEVVYTSDLCRAIATAEAIAQHFHCPVITAVNLREIHFGRWEGLTWAQIEALDRDHAARWIREFPLMPAPEGEAFSAFEQRVLDEIFRIDEASRGRRTVIVTHGGVMRVILQRLCGASDEEAWKQTHLYCSSFRYDRIKSRTLALSGARNA